jgi:DNA-binding MarR family transcriptional regulator/GNAT superfamily N-acetyltransferase
VIDGALIASVRRFNRVVTQRAGVLDDDHLGRGRTLREDRLLWEIGLDGCDVRDLRVRLDLDSGYLSRLLRALEHAGLVEVTTSDADRRVRRAHLTRAGRREVGFLDRRSDDLARSILEPLPERDRDRLVAAMGEVERLLTAALVVVDVADPDSPAGRHCLDAYYAELNTRFDTGFDPVVSRPADGDVLRPPVGLLLVATLRGVAVGCGALKLHGKQPAEIKRMWVAPSARGLGVGRRLLADLEARARDARRRKVRLDTNRNLTEAIAMYRSSGYREVGAFNDEPYADLWFEKAL